jgi:hypothetical protein
VLKEKKLINLTMKYWLTLIVALEFIFGGCNDQNRCYDSVNTLMVAKFVISDFIVFDTLVIKGVGRNAAGDTLANDTTSAQSKRFTLPLSLSADSTGFVLLGNISRDTIYIRHSMTMKFISEYCGFAPEYHIKGIFFTSGIDSVRISDALVNTQSIAKNTNDQNITIYFNPSVH